MFCTKIQCIVTYFSFLLPLPFHFFPTQSLCGAEWLHRCFEGTVHWQCNGPALPVPASPVWIHRPAPESVPPESYPHQPAGGSRGTGPTGHTHAHWGRVNINSKAMRVVNHFTIIKCTNPHVMILSLAQVSGHSGGAVRTIVSAGGWTSLQTDLLD